MAPGASRKRRLLLEIIHVPSVWIGANQPCTRGLLASYAAPKIPKQSAASPAEALTTLPGFKVELLHSSEAATEGSWINMAKDGKGRLIISGQNKQPILRVTLKDGKVEKIEKLKLPISEAMGLLYAFDSLYVDGAGPQGLRPVSLQGHQGDRSVRRR